MTPFLMFCFLSSAHSHSLVLLLLLLFFLLVLVSLLFLKWVVDVDDMAAG